MKKLINDPTTVVTDALAGIAAAHPELRIDHERKVIYRADSPVAGKVGLISGGGSGHEPLHGGFVGLGMLDAACAGEVFTSPTPDQMHEATKLVDAGAGVLHIVKNYTGDVLNFEMAAEMAAEEAGVKVKPSSPTMTSPSKTACTRPAAAVSESRSSSRRSAAPPPRTEPIWRRWQPSHARSTAGAAAWAWPSRRAPCRLPGNQRSSSPTPRWRSASGSTANQAATANRSAPRPRSLSGCSTRS